MRGAANVRRAWGGAVLGIGHAGVSHGLVQSCVPEDTDTCEHRVLGRVSPGSSSSAAAAPSLSCQPGCLPVGGALLCDPAPRVPPAQDRPSPMHPFTRSPFIKIEMASECAFVLTI